jgi:hypothetical protein
MWERRHPTTLWASTACYRDNFLLTFFSSICSKFDSYEAKMKHMIGIKGTAPPPTHTHKMYLVTAYEILFLLLWQSKSRYDWLSISQYVEVSSPLWDLWPDITFCPQVVWKLLSCLCRAPSLTRGRVFHLSFSVFSNLPVFTSSIYVSCVLQFNILYTKLLSVPAQYSRLCSISYY